jgi:hypothetical protein
MWRYLTGGLAALLLVAVAVLVIKTPARSGSPLPAAPPAAQGLDGEPLPDSVPEASPKTREEKRFNRYDKDRDALITRDEYLAARRKAYAKLDTNKDGRLSFDEWAAKTAAKFAAADRDGSGGMTASEFIATAPKRRAPVRIKCPPTAETAASQDDT